MWRGQKNTVYLAEADTGKSIRKMDCNPRHIIQPRLAVSPDGRILAGSLDSPMIFLWDTDSGKQVGKLDGHRCDIQSICYSLDGRYLVTGSADTTILIWDVRKLQFEKQ